jgi:hypothetical protein
MSKKKKELTTCTTPEDWAFEIGFRHGRRARDPASKAFDEVRGLSSDPDFEKKFNFAFAAGMAAAFAENERHPAIVDGGLLDIGDGTYKSFVAQLTPPAKE